MAHVFWTKHDTDNRGRASSPLYRPKTSWTLVHKLLKTGPEFLPTIRKFYILLHLQASHTEVSKQNSLNFVTYCEVNQICKYMFKILGFALQNFKGYKNCVYCVDSHLDETMPRKNWGMSFYSFSLNARHDYGVSEIKWRREGVCCPGQTFVFPPPSVRFVLQSRYFSWFRTWVQWNGSTPIYIRLLCIAVTISCNWICKQ